MTLRQDDAHIQAPDIAGLSAVEVDERVARGAVNVTHDTTSRSVATIIRANVCTLFNGIIAVAMVLVLLTGSWRDAVFGMVIIINTGIGIITELRAKRTLDRLSILVASQYTVRRDGCDMQVGHDHIVMDDVLWLHAGDQVPADAQILRNWGLELDESMLTGESRTVHGVEGKTVYSGSSVVAGAGLVRVTAVGASSYAAKLTAQAKVYRKTISDLNRGINTILKFMTIVVVPLCVLLVWSQMHALGGVSVAWQTGQWRHAVVSAVAGVVGMIPEGLVLLTSLNFAVAAMRLARRQTLVQELESVETLARVDALNLDKTGTITDGGMVMSALVMLREDYADDTRQALYDVCDEPQPNGTGAAVLAYLRGQGVVPGAVDERVPFSSARKWSAVRVRDTWWYMGAPEMVMAALQDDVVREAASQVSQLAGQGHRVLVVARATDGGAHEGNAGVGEPVIASSAVPVALVLCDEHVREDAEQTLAWFRQQGVRCRVISGDNPVTVAAIARKVRLAGDRDPVAVDARTLPDDPQELARVLEEIDVVGRVLPEQKKAIVDALHTRGHVVAMTGDGVNDALAIKEADLGIAMGNAAPATKAVAQVVLVDSKFSHLPDVVARGRQVMANMERVASLFLVKTVYSALISFGVVLTQIPYPYLPRHITYVGGLTIGIPAFLLSLASNTRRYIPGFLGRVVRFALPGGIATGLSVLLTAWLLPVVMGWHVLDSAYDLAQLRATSAILLFVMGVSVLSLVARPLHTWRGLLVLACAACGVAGMAIPLVARFFALRLPSGDLLRPTVVSLVIAVAMFMLCHWLSPYVQRACARVNRWWVARRRLT